ncbi:MAG: DUF2240 family protein [Methanosarcinales archaeon]|nr:DUF2240 family protein [Methanosarcinales archaeon]
MNELLFTAAMPFKRKGTDTIKETEFVMALSMDLGWFKPDTARGFINSAIEKGIISREGDMLKAQFGINDVQIPMGFKPDVSGFQKKEVFEQIIERIMINTGLEKQTIIAEINKSRNEKGGLFSIEVLGILMAREYGIQVDDLIDKSYRGLLKR